MSDSICMDLDDFADDQSWCLYALDALHQQSHGRLKCTLFTIPNRTSVDLFEKALKRDWVELAVHGWDHTPLECKEWSRDRTAEVLGGVSTRFAKVFKAPYWEASDAVYGVLQDRGWAVADHPRNVSRVPLSLRSYVLSPDHRIGVHHHLLPIVQAHGHCGNVEGNGLRERFEDFRRLAVSGMPFQFVSEVDL